MNTNYMRKKKTAPSPKRRFKNTIFFQDHLFGNNLGNMTTRKLRKDNLVSWPQEANASKSHNFAV